jgi:predicted RNase H-like HicB family nuclease
MNKQNPNTRQKIHWRNPHLSHLNPGAGRHLPETEGKFFRHTQDACGIRPSGYPVTMKRILTAILTREGGGFVALCPEVDVASQGATVEEAKANLQEAVELFFECASEEEIQQRMSSESYVSMMEVQLA